MNIPQRNICLVGGTEIRPKKFIGFIDYDVKTNKNGLISKRHLETLGFDFPETRRQKTPSGGFHDMYLFSAPIGNSVGSLASGIDVRGHRGYVLGAGSRLGSKSYDLDNDSDIQDAPDWLDSQLTVEAQASRRLTLVREVDQAEAKRRALAFLDILPDAIAGARNDEGFKVVCRLKDFGCTPDLVRELLDSWRCRPPLDFAEMEQLIVSAFKYGKNSYGIDHSQNAFDPVPVLKEAEPPVGPPIDVMNSEYFYTEIGATSCICNEIINADGEKDIQRLAVKTFQNRFANKSIDLGNGKSMNRASWWFTSAARREHKGLVFDPSAKADSAYYNLWQGFRFEPVDLDSIDPRGVEGAKLYLEHVLENICGGDKGLAEWVLTWVAHIFQHPEEKPTAAIVLQGEKGTGKNVFSDVIAHLLGRYAVTFHDRGRLTHNFNSAQENKLLLVFDETFWAGEKAIDSKLKSLVTSKKRLIERKGFEAYDAKCFDRIVILGNEERIVPATIDERRYAVFKMGNRNRKDRLFFGAIIDGVEKHGGDKWLFTFFKNFDLSRQDVHSAPETEGLKEQKRHGLTGFAKWWEQCLEAEEIIGASFVNGWPEGAIQSRILVEACNGKVSPYDQVTVRTLRKWLLKFAPSSKPGRLRLEGGYMPRTYQLAPLLQAKKEFNAACGFDSEDEDEIN